LSNTDKIVPRHVAVIMDGNGRWAERRGFERAKGHEAGAESVRAIVRACGEVGVEVLTLYSFSTENWRRPHAEIQALMGLLQTYLTTELGELMDNNVRLTAIGELKALPLVVRAALQSVIVATSKNTGMRLVLALSYGSRAEIASAVRDIAQKVKRGQIKPRDIDESVVADHLYTAGLVEPDFVIRTSGEYRLSNFLLWQIAYAEIYVTEVEWPDFREEQLALAFQSFKGRKRRFGAVSSSTDVEEP
jgi:undecaprenyl diphosphate synthase